MMKTSLNNSGAVQKRVRSIIWQSLQFGCFNRSSWRNLAAPSQLAAQPKGQESVAAARV
jgi:hypothetical protein